MRLQAYDDNGTMKFRQVSGSQALDSLPVGTTIGYVGGVIPNGYLEADGSTFDVSKYPELYSILGSDTLPELFDHDRRDTEYTDIRSQVGSTVQTAYEMPYDGDITFTGGGYSQSYCVFYILKADGTTLDWSGSFAGTYDGASSSGGSALFLNKGDKFYAAANNSQRSTFIHARFYKKHLLIKAATIGIADIDINTIKNSLSYSTDEVLTGGTWIDGKPIYRKVIQVNQAAPATIPTGLTNVDFIDVRVKANCQGTTPTTGVGHGFYVSTEINNQVGGQSYYFGEENVLWRVTSSFTGYVYWVILEYTKR